MTVEYYGRGGEELCAQALAPLVHRTVRASVFTDRFEPQMTIVGEVGTEEEAGRLRLMGARRRTGSHLLDGQECHTVMETLDDGEAVTVLTIGEEFPWTTLESAVTALAEAVPRASSPVDEGHRREWAVWDGERLNSGSHMFGPSSPSGRIAAFDGRRPVAEPLDRFFLSMPIHAPLAICVRLPRDPRFRSQWGLSDLP